MIMYKITWYDNTERDIKWYGSGWFQTTFSIIGYIGDVFIMFIIYMFLL